MSGESNKGATKLEWSDDDEDDFFSEDGQEVNVSEDEVLEEDLSDEIAGLESSDLTNVVDDAAMEIDTNNDCNEEDNDAMDHPEDVSEASPSRTAVPTRTLPSPSPGLPPLSGRTQKEKSSGSVASETPLSIADESESTALVEPEDQDFEEIVRKRNRVRKEREDYHIAHIKVQMGRLEDALAAETKRRVDATTALDELARTQVHKMEERVREQLKEENEMLQARLTALEERVRTLEENWVGDANRQMEVVENKAADLSKCIAQIRDDQNMERKARLKREGILLRQVEEHAKDAEDSWKAERKDRTKRLKELEDQIIRNEARLALEQKRYEDRIEEELASLRNEVEAEAVERETQDEIIVAALNRYTKQLQHSLSILSSD